MVDAERLVSGGMAGGTEFAYQVHIIVRVG